MNYSFINMKYKLRKRKFSQNDVHYLMDGGY